MKKIFRDIINSLLAGALVFFGAFSSGEVTMRVVVLAISTSAIVAITKFKDSWAGVNTSNMISFI